MVNQTVLKKIIRRVVETADPEKIVLFGSAARNEETETSDVDILVIKDCDHRRKLAQKIYMNLIDVDIAVDVVVIKPDDIDRYKDSDCLVVQPALEEGEIIYAA